MLRVIHATVLLFLSTFFQSSLVYAGMKEISKTDKPSQYTLSTCNRCINPIFTEYRKECFTSDTAETLPKFSKLRNLMNDDFYSIARGLSMSNSSDCASFLKFMTLYRGSDAWNADSGKLRIEILFSRQPRRIPPNSGFPSTIKVTTQKDRTTQYVSKEMRKFFQPWNPSSKYYKTSWSTKGITPRLFKLRVYKKR